MGNIKAAKAKKKHYHYDDDGGRKKEGRVGRMKSRRMPKLSQAEFRKDGKDKGVKGVCKKSKKLRIG